MGAHFFHHLLTSLLVPLLPFIRDGFNLSYTQSGVIVSAFTLSYGLGQLPSGWIADRVSRRYLLLAGISGVAIAGALIGLIGSYIGLVVFLILMGVLGGGYHPSASPLMSAAVPPQQRGKAVGLHITGGSSSHFVTPLAAVLIAGVAGWRGAYLFISIPVFIFGIWLFYVLRRNKIRVVREDESGSSASPEEKQSQKETHPAGYKEVILFLFITAAIGSVIASCIAFFPLFIVDVFGINEKTAAVFLSLYFLVGMAAAPLSGMAADRFGSRKVFFVVAACSAPALLLFAASFHWIMVGITLIILSVVSFGRMIVSETFFVTLVPAKNRSTVLGIYFFAGMEASGVLTPLVGRAIDSWGFARSFSLMGLILLGICILAAVVYSIISISSRRAAEKAGKTAV